MSITRKFRKYKIRIRAGAEQTAPGEHHKKIRKFKIRIRAGAEQAAPGESEPL